ncbi:hypothetical protein H1R20_g5189, partial [Candolleomyces eurysporus]
MMIPMFLNERPEIYKTGPARTNTVSTRCNLAGTRTYPQGLTIARLVKATMIWWAER